MCRPETNIRRSLLAGVAQFVHSVERCSGVHALALIGSIATDKREPKDVDLLVAIDAGADLRIVARYARPLLGRAQAVGRGVDVFLSDPEGCYLGRTCLWKHCAPGVRVSCDALHCGRRQFLYDDLSAIRLSDDALKTAPVQLLPKVVRRAPLPDDVEAMLADLENLATDR